MVGRQTQRKMFSESTGHSLIVMRINFKWATGD